MPVLPGGPDKLDADGQPSGAAHQGQIHAGKPQHRPEAIEDRISNRIGSRTRLAFGTERHDDINFFENGSNLLPAPPPEILRSFIALPRAGPALFYQISEIDAE